MLKADELLNRLAESADIERYDRYDQKIHYYVREEYNCVDYNDIIWPCDMLVNKDEKVDYMCSLLKTIVEEDSTRKDDDNYKNGNKEVDIFHTEAFKTYRVFKHWALDEYKDEYIQKYYSFNPNLTIGINELKGSKGYTLGIFIYANIVSGLAFSRRMGGNDNLVELSNKSDEVLEKKLANNVNKYIYDKLEMIEKVAKNKEKVK